MKRRPPSSSSKSVERSCTIADHERIKASPAAWVKLPPCGFMSDGMGTTYEMRHCPRCLSTLNKACEVVVVRYLDEPPPAAPLLRVGPLQLAVDARGAA